LPLFRKPVAQIYVTEVRQRMDPLVIPIFSPDTAIDVGDFGSFEDGRFVRYGTLADRGVALEKDENPTNPFEFASSGKVSIGPSIKVPNPLGGELVSAKLKFEHSRAVIASFKGGFDRSIRDGDAFQDVLADLWASKRLRTDRAVVWSMRGAPGGTVVVSEDGDNELEVSADSALLGPAGITLGNLSLGVNFGAERHATWKMSEPTGKFVVWARLYKLDPRSQTAINAFRFEPGGSRPNVRTVQYSSDELLDQLERD
jgi:hypothetical protein